MGEVQRRQQAMYREKLQKTQALVTCCTDNTCQMVDQHTQGRISLVAWITTRADYPQKSIGCDISTAECGFYATHLSLRRTSNCEQSCRALVVVWIDLLSQKAFKQLSIVWLEFDRDWPVDLATNVAHNLLNLFFRVRFVAYVSSKLLDPKKMWKSLLSFQRIEQEMQLALIPKARCDLKFLLALIAREVVVIDQGNEDR